eukprot:9499141-Pyramimonas_sp.AAC.1
MALSEDVVKGAIHIALGFSTAGVMSDFRACLRHVVRAKIKIFRGRPPLETMVYRRAAIRTFVPGGGNESIRRALLHILPNGDWTNTENVEVWIAGDGPIDEERVIQRVVDGMLSALVHRRPRVWKRIKWIGKEEALCDIGLIEVCHGLLTPTYRLWAKRRGCKVPHPHHSGQPGHVVPMIEDVGGDGDEAEARA